MVLDIGDTGGLFQPAEQLEHFQDPPRGFYRAGFLLLLTARHLLPQFTPSPRGHGYANPRHATYHIPDALQSRYHARQVVAHGKNCRIPQHSPLH